MDYANIGRNTANVVRFTQVLQVFVRHGLADLLRRAGFHNSLPVRVLRKLNLLNAPAGAPETLGERICAALTELGPTYVKFGQILSTRPDLVTSDIAVALSALQDRVDPLPFETMSKVIEEALGEPVSARFQSIDPKPVASASLSQVYRATLPTGEAVAVKVQRPDIDRVIRSDLSMMHQMAEWLAEHMEEEHWLDPVGMVDEFSRSLRRELDFRLEARIIERFAENFKDNPNCFIPAVYKSHSRERILTMDWVDGVRVDKFEEYAERRCDRKAISLLGCSVLSEMVFKHRLFHADPHPANIFLLRDNRIAFLDLGMAGHLERADVDAIADLLFAIFRQDSHACANAALRLTSKGHPENREAFEHELAEFIAFEAHSIVGGGQVGRGIDRAVEIIRRHGLSLAPRFSLLLKTLATIESVGRALDPEMDMVPIMRPYIEKLITERFQPGHIMRDLQTNAQSAFQLMRQIPGDLSYVLERLRRGKLMLQLHHEHLENLAGSIDRASNRIATGLIIAALIIGSSMLTATESAMSQLGITGFIAAGILGLLLVASFIRTGKF